MKIGNLLCLIEVSKTQSLNKASERMFITQPALSNIIKNMEDEIEAPILERASKGVQFTAAGNVLLEYAQKTLENYEMMRLKIKDLQDEFYNIEGKVHFYWTAAFAQKKLQEHIYQFSVKHPNIQIKTSIAEVDEIYSSLGTNDDAVALLCFPYNPFLGNKKIDGKWLPPNGYGLKVKAEGKCVALVSEKSRFAKHKKIKLKVLLEEPLIVLSQSGDLSSLPIYSDLLTRGFDIKTQLVTYDYDTWLKAIGENRGVGIATNLSISNNQLKVIELDECIEFCVCLCYSENSSPAVKMFLNYIDKIF